MLKRTYEAYDKCAVLLLLLLLLLFIVILRDVNEQQQVFLYNGHLSLIKVPPQNTLDSISLVTPYMKFESSGIKFTETAPVQHVSPTNDKYIRPKTLSI